jgi:hypothetical protein
VIRCAVATELLLGAGERHDVHGWIAKPARDGSSDDRRARIFESSRCVIECEQNAGPEPCLRILS